MGVDPKDLLFQAATCLAVFQRDHVCSYAAIVCSDRTRSALTTFFRHGGLLLTSIFSGLDLVELAHKRAKSTVPHEAPRGARMECFKCDCVTMCTDVYGHKSLPGKGGRPSD